MPSVSTHLHSFGKNSVSTFNVDIAIDFTVPTFPKTRSNWRHTKIQCNYERTFRVLPSYAGKGLILLADKNFRSQPCDFAHPHAEHLVRDQGRRDRIMCIPAVIGGVFRFPQAERAKGQVAFRSEERFVDHKVCQDTGSIPEQYDGHPFQM